MVVRHGVEYRVTDTRYSAFDENRLSLDIEIFFGKGSGSQEPFDCPENGRFPCIVVSNDRRKRVDAQLSGITRSKVCDFDELN